MQMPPRPEPSVRVPDFDDTCAYSGMVAGAEESRSQKALLDEVKTCLIKSQFARIKRLAKLDYDSVRTALYDVWIEGRQHESLHYLSKLAAEKTAELGDKSLQEFDLKHPPRS